VVIATTLLLLTTFSISEISTAQTNNTPVTFTLAIPNNIDNFNPFESGFVWAEQVVGLVYPEMVMIGPNNTLEPYLATSWNINPSNGTAIFYLNQNAKWSDGVSINSTDVVYTYNCYLKPWDLFHAYFASLKSVTALGPYTVMFNFTGISFVYTDLNMAIVPYHIWKNLNASSYFGFSANTTFVGGGPFLLSGYTPGQSVVLIKNPNFWDPKYTPHVDKLILEIFSSQSTQYAALTSGQIDASDITPTELSSAMSNPNLKVMLSQSASNYFITFNQNSNGTGNPALRDIHVREALEYALNISYLIKLGFLGHATPIASLVPVQNPFYSPYLKPWPYNVSLANQILDKYGYKYGPNGIRESPSGVPLEFTLLVVSSSAHAIDQVLAPVMAKNWSQIGIKVNVKVYDEATILSEMRHYNYDMTLWAYTGVLSWPTLLRIFLSIYQGISNYPGYNNRTYDQTYFQMMSSMTLTQAKKYAYELQNLTYYNSTVDFLYSPMTIYAYNSKWTNINSSLVSTYQTNSMPGFGSLWNLLSVRLNTTSSSSSIPLNYTLIMIIVIVVIVIAVTAFGVFYYTKKRKNNK
ncbi:MAG: ABC transporter substrate-binding protein, partial [Caldisphaera sp.]